MTRGLSITYTHIFYAFSGNCLAHKTAVASGALVLYLRYLCHPDAAEVFSLKPPQRATLQHNSVSSKPVLQPPGAGGIDKVHNAINPESNGNNGKVNIDTNLHVALEKDNVGNNVNKLNLVENSEVNGVKLKDTTQVAYDNNHLAINNNLVKDGYKYDDEYDNDNNEGDENGADDGNDMVNENADVGHINDDYQDDDDDYDNDDDDDYDYPVNRDDAGVDGGQYDDKQFEDNANNADVDDDDDDDDYNADDGGYNQQQDNIPPHLHARNIGNAGSKDYDGKFGDSNKREPVKDYDDDEGDDYVYDDEEEDDDGDKKRADAVPDVKVKVKEYQGIPNLHNQTLQTESLSYSAVFTVSAICIIAVFILWRCLRKRRLRLRVGHKYFHV